MLKIRSDKILAGQSVAGINQSKYFKLTIMALDLVEDTDIHFDIYGGDAYLQEYLEQWNIFLRYM